MRVVLSAIVPVFFIMSASADTAPKVTESDLSGMISDKWTGALTYLNYQEPFIDFTIPAAATVTPIEGGFEVFYQYPDEPHMNGSSEIKIGQNGTEIDGYSVVSNRVTEDGEREVRSRGACEDMGQSASCEMVYIVSETSLSLKRLVTYDGETETFRRNEFAFVRSVD